MMSKKVDTRVGRPVKNDGPAFPAEEVDRLLVSGEEIPVGDGSAVTVAFPSLREIARRFDVSHSLIARYAQQHDCLGRRKRAQRRIEHRADEKLIELRAEALAVTRDDQVRTIDRFLVQFERALQEGRVRCDNPSDFNVMVRLREFILGEADSRTEVVNGMPTLEELQARHREMLQAGRSDGRRSGDETMGTMGARGSAHEAGEFGEDGEVDDEEDGLAGVADTEMVH